MKALLVLAALLLVASCGEEKDPTPVDTGSSRTVPAADPHGPPPPVVARGAGEQQEALRLLHTLPPTNLHSWDEDFLRALDDFVNHRHAAAIAQLDGMVHKDDFASGLRIASLLCMGQVDKAKITLSTMRPHPADFLQTFANVLTVRRVDTVLRTRVMAELAAAKAW